MKNDNNQNLPTSKKLIADFIDAVTQFDDKELSLIAIGIVRYCGNPSLFSKVVNHETQVITA